MWSLLSWMDMSHPLPFPARNHFWSPCCILFATTVLSHQWFQNLPWQSPVPIYSKKSTSIKNIHIDHAETLIPTLPAVSSHSLVQAGFKSLTSQWVASITWDWFQFKTCFLHISLIKTFLHCQQFLQDMIVAILTYHNKTQFRSFYWLFNTGIIFYVTNYTRSTKFGLLCFNLEVHSQRSSGIFETLP